MSAFSPRRIVVKEVIRSRYPKGVRPASWDERCSGIDQIKSDDGEVLTLFSDGQQSPPQVGWTILLTSPATSESSLRESSASSTRSATIGSTGSFDAHLGPNGPVYRWTLYGMGYGLKRAS